MSTKHALLIGISKYQDKTLARLQKPEVDVSALAEVLLDPKIGGFDEVQTLTNPPSGVLRRQIAQLFNRRRYDNLVLLYFAGHGVRDINDGKFYLAATDTNRNLLSAEGISADFIKREMANSGSQRQVLILDCCFSGAFSRDARSAVGTYVDMEEIAQGKGKVVMTASTATQFAWEEGGKIIGEPENSVFTRHLVTGLKTGKADIDGDGWISFDELYDYVRSGVISTIGTRQTPTKSGEQIGVLLLARNQNFSGKITRELDGFVSSAEVNRLLAIVQDSIYPILMNLNQKALASSFHAKGAHLGELNQTEKTTPVVLLGMTGVGKTSLMNAILGKVVGRVGSSGGAQSAAALVVSKSPKRFIAETSYISLDDLLEHINRVRANAVGNKLTKRPDEQRLARYLVDFLETALADPQVIYEREVTLDDLRESVAELIQLGSRHESFTQNDNDALSEYVKRHTNSNGLYWVITKEMQIKGPFPGLPEHVKIMDLPGLGDLNGLRVEKTKQSLKEAEQIIIVMDDRGFLKSIREMLGETHIISFLLTNPNIPQIMVIGTKLENIDQADFEVLHLDENAEPHRIIQAKFDSWSETAKGQWEEMLRDWVEGTSIGKGVDYSTVEKILEKTEFIPCSPRGFLQLMGLEKDYLQTAPKLFHGADGQVNYEATGIPRVRKSIKNLADEQQRLRKVKIKGSYQELRHSTLEGCRNLLKGLLADIEYSENTKETLLKTARKISRIKDRKSDYRLAPAIQKAKNKLDRTNTMISQGWQELNKEVIDEIFNRTLGKEHFMVVMATYRRALVYKSDKANIHIPKSLDDYVALPITNFVYKDVFETFLKRAKQAVNDSDATLQELITKYLDALVADNDNELMNTYKEQVESILVEHHKEVGSIADRSLGNVSVLGKDVLDWAYLAIQSGFHSILKDPIEKAALEDEAKGRGARQRVINKLVEITSDNQEDIIFVTAETFTKEIIEHLHKHVENVEEQLVNVKLSMITSIKEHGEALLATITDQKMKENARKLEMLLSDV